jgi:hypothetical protein
LRAVDPKLSISRPLAIVGTEIKASATVTTGDFSGLRKLAEACGKRFILGLVWK